MKSCIAWGTLAIVTFATILLACSATTPSAPVTVTTGTNPQNAASPASVPPLNAADESWNKTIEAAKKEGSLTAYSYTFAGDTGLAVSQAFKKKYGISVEVVAGQAPVFLERIQSEARSGTHIADIAELPIVRAPFLANSGLVASLKDLPVFGEKNVWFANPLEVDPSGQSLVMSYTYSIPSVNTSIVKAEEEPQSWLDLLQPKWKGKLISLDPGIGIGPATIYYIHVLKSGRLTEEQFRKLGPQISRFYGGNPRDEALALARGEGSISLGGSGSATGPLIAEGAPLKALDLKEGAYGSAQVIQVLNKGPHPNAARLFVNWILSAEGMKVLSEAASLGGVRKDVPDRTPPAGRVDQSKAVLLGIEDGQKVQKLFSDQIVAKMWKGEGATK